MAEALFVFITIAILSEAIWENLKVVFPGKPPMWISRAAPMILAIFMCIATGSDMFAVFGIVLPLSSGAFFSGILTGRGSNVIHDIAMRIKDGGNKAVS